MDDIIRTVCLSSVWLGALAALIYRLISPKVFLEIGAAIHVLYAVWDFLEYGISQIFVFDLVIFTVLVILWWKHRDDDDDDFRKRRRRLWRRVKSKLPKLAPRPAQSSV